MSQSRGRLVFAAAAAAGLVAAVVAVALSGGAEEAAADECLAAWNEDATARSDGVHAYNAHGYRATLLARVDSAGELVTPAEGPPGPEERCLVVFASPQVDMEPDFGVRVLERGRWTGFAPAEKVPLERVEELQRDATETANVTLLPDGRLAD